MIVRSKAPFRIGLAGGGTDVSPYSDKFGGAILNATIELFAYTTIIERNDGKIVFRSEDNGTILEYKSENELPIDGTLDLQKGVYNHIVKYFHGKPLSFEMITSMDVPSGSGLGTSSTLVVSMIGAFKEWLKLPLGEYDIAHLAYQIERKDLNMAGGKQDQYAATFGGFNFMEFSENEKVIVNPLRIYTKLRNELQFNLLLYYTKTSRQSSKIIEEQAENIVKSNKNSIEATHHVKAKAFEMKEALLKGELDKIGTILHQSWLNKKQMATGISNQLIDEVYQKAMQAGALGGKISGAGGGGFMVFYANTNKRYDVIRALKRQGGIVIPYQFTEKGVETWTIH
jgi:D-glycero-alpha-D-manno-heptose-7-phosphate kinase